MAYIKLLRPKQWIKNCFVFAGLIFARHFTQSNELFLTLGAFICFSLISSTVYILNDILDLEIDRNHPVNCNRPIASGKISVKSAIMLGCVTLCSSLAFSYYLSPGLSKIILAYFVMNIFYSFKLKQIVILDVFIIATGFVLRVLAGTTVIAITPSHWLLLCTFLLSLFLGFSKRRHELILIGEGKKKTRVVLSKYSPYFLDQMLALITPSVFLSYVLYTVDAETVAKYGGTHLVYTTPFVIYGIFRYQYLVYKKDQGNPNEIIFSDATLIICIILWMGSFLYLAA